LCASVRISAIALAVATIVTVRGAVCISIMTAFVAAVHVTAGHIM
jgi:hypothetical protein